MSAGIALAPAGLTILFGPVASLAPGPSHGEGRASWRAVWILALARGYARYPQFMVTRRESGIVGAAYEPLRRRTRVVPQKLLARPVTEWIRRAQEVSSQPMNKTLDLVSLSPWLAPCLQTADNARRITAAEAKAHVGQSVIVTGRVMQVSAREKTVYLNLDKTYPLAPFTAVIFARAMNQFTNLQALEGKRVEISGKVIQFQDRPEIVLADKRQLRVLDDPVQAAPS